MLLFFLSSGFFYLKLTSMLAIPRHKLPSNRLPVLFVKFSSSSSSFLHHFPFSRNCWLGRRKNKNSNRNLNLKFNRVNNRPFFVYFVSKWRILKFEMLLKEGSSNVMAASCKRFAGTAKMEWVWRACNYSKVCFLFSVNHRHHLLLVFCQVI